MRFFVMIFFYSLLASCGGPGKNSETEYYFEKEIKNRIEIIQQHPEQFDSSGIDPVAIDREVDKIILLSKDVENLGASVQRANEYFRSMANQYRISVSDFTELNSGMHVDHISSVLKQNELSLLNQLIFKNSTLKIPLRTAQ